MADDYVKRSDVHKAFQPKYAPAINRTFAAIIDSVPAADVVEVRHGQWINERQEGLGSFSAECSQCGKRTLAYFHYFYCPSCGAKMDGGQKA